MSFNRTILGLKSEIEKFKGTYYEGFNRTILGLK